MRKLSKYEKETIINWNEAENLASVYTFNAGLKRRLEDFSRKYPLLCRLERSTPDVMTCAKALGCGVPVGAFVLNKKTAEHSLVPGDHGTTYGGNPLACAAVNAVFECYEKQHVVEHVAETAPYLEKKLDELVEKYDCLAARRGKGFMQGLVVTGRPVGEVINRAIENGLLVISAGSDVLRMVPPLVITKDDIDEMIEKLEKALQ